MGDAKALTCNELAAHYGVTPDTVNYWRRQGLPALQKRTPKGALRYSLSRVALWLDERGIVPGDHGVEGGRARQEQVRASAVTPTPTPTVTDVVLAPSPDVPVAGGETLADTLAHLHAVEADLARRVMGADGGGGGLVKRWTEVVGQLRQTYRNLREEQVQQGLLIPRDRFLDEMCALASLLVGAVQQFPSDVVPGLVGALGDTVNDPAALERSLYAAAEPIVDGWRRNMAERVRNVRREYGDTGGGSLGGGRGDTGAPGATGPGRVGRAVLPDQDGPETGAVGPGVVPLGDADPSGAG